MREQILNKLNKLEKSVAMRADDDYRMVISTAFEWIKTALSKTPPTSWPSFLRNYEAASWSPYQYAHEGDPIQLLAATRGIDAAELYPCICCLTEHLCAAFGGEQPRSQQSTSLIERHSVSVTLDFEVLNDIESLAEHLTYRRREVTLYWERYWYFVRVVFSSEASSGAERLEIEYAAEWLATSLFLQPAEEWLDILNHFWSKPEALKPATDQLQEYATLTGVSMSKVVTTIKGVAHHLFVYFGGHPSNHWHCIERILFPLASEGTE